MAFHFLGFKMENLIILLKENKNANQENIEKYGSWGLYKIKPEISCDIKFKKLISIPHSFIHIIFCNYLDVCLKSRTFSSTFDRRIRNILLFEILPYLHLLMPTFIPSVKDFENVIDSSRELQKK